MHLEKNRQKLLISKSTNFAALNVPPELQILFKGLKSDLKSPFDFVILFAESNAELEALMKSGCSNWKLDTLFWASYPKGSSKFNVDIKRNTLIDVVKVFGLRPVTQISLNETWTAMRLRPFDRVGT